MIRSLLIANRGEIAIRIMRSCARLGIRTIAVFSDADRGARHVALADEAVRIGPAPARDSYLRPDVLVQAALRTGAEAIHPGYGFLSEKPELARLCTAAGLVWVGPSADRIAAMGAKIGAKRIAARAGVASVPGYAGEDQSIPRLLEEARRLGLPLMVKASAGGGGKGMRVVRTDGELRPALDLARQEAAAAFGDGSLLIEKLVERPRHLEVQVAGDRHGNVVHLFERDCSVQRHHQKLLEEAPASGLPERLRVMLLERGVALARAIAYDNLGTVEFILGEGQEEPWFLEMNTRLQVEHTVTEAITGLDLVEWQIRLACGEVLPLRQDEIQRRGHAIEARITAEQAAHGFRPDTGPIVLYREPDGVRVDSGIAAGTEVTSFYDSLLAKVIAWGEMREDARARLAGALRDFVILGPATTLPFLADAVAHPIFADGEATTSFIADAFAEGWRPGGSNRALARAAAAVFVATADAAAPGAPSFWSRLAGFRVLAPAGGVAETVLLVRDGAETARVVVSALADGRHGVRDPDGEVAIRLDRQGETLALEADGRVLPVACRQTGSTVRIFCAGEAHEFTIIPQVRAAGAGAAARHAGAVSAPMPGVIAEVRVAPGDTVTAGQVVVVLESMKLFTPLAAEADGIVSEVACRAGQTVRAGDVLLLIASADDGTKADG
jgi:3-methylcrotonyl-CoA carboxylase alpha subunit